jgi:hypothetical protein
VEGYQKGKAQVTTNHDKVPLGNVERLGAFKNDNKAYSNQGIDHAKGKTGYHQLQKEGH